MDDFLSQLTTGLIWFWDKLSSWIVNGFMIGEIRIQPLSILLGLLFLYIFLKASRFIRSKIESSWLNATHLSKSEREAAGALIWYVAIVISVVVGMSIAGINITNLALIAGALSVGIGFGLQNIVSNFISGIILLFEQPVKRGDWIKVGDTEGFVKEINVRSTRVQTFDRSDVLVPNSDLITNQVTNWTLTDPIGRIIIPIGVAYGSDVDKVRDVLLEVARNHPATVLGHSEVPDPRVLFMRFGDSSLDFELRMFVKNIADMYVITSQVNFEIVRAFNAAKIEIPFPQRDLHIKDWRHSPDNNNHLE